MCNFCKMYSNESMQIGDTIMLGVRFVIVGDGKEFNAAPIFCPMCGRQLRIDDNKSGGVTNLEKFIEVFGEEPFSDKNVCFPKGNMCQGCQSRPLNNNWWFRKYRENTNDG